MNLRLTGIAACALALPLVHGGVAHAQQYNSKTPGYAQAVSAFEAASIVVLGRDLSTKQEKISVMAGPGKGGYTGTGGSGMGSYFTTNEMVYMFGEYDHWATAPDEKIKDGIKFTDAVKFLKAKLKTESQSSNKMILILLGKVFSESLGRDFTANEQSKWTARIKNEGLWYAPVKLELMKQAQTDKKERAALIGRAYWYTLGRGATADEQKYWMPRSEYYDQIVAANRSWLLKGPGAAEEFPQVVRRALKVVLNAAFPPEDAVKQYVDVFSAGDGKVYGEMVAYLQKPKSKK